MSSDALPIEAAAGLPIQRPADAEPGRRRINWKVALFAVAAVLGGAWAQSGGDGAAAVLSSPAVALAAFAALAGGLLFAVRPAAATRGAVAMASAAPTAGSASTTLSEQVVPVWQRSVEAARSHSERSISGLLESFGSICGQLDGALGSPGAGTSLELGAVDDLLARHQPEIERLLTSTRLAARLKDDMLAGVVALSQTLAEMSTLAREVQSIGRATHMLALNASVVATRAGGSERGSFGVVAVEVRKLAGQSREAGQQLARRIAAMQQRCDALLRDCARHDTDDDELDRQATHSARAVVQAVLGSIADFSRSSFALRDASRHVQQELEKISMSLQAQDRLSQMLTSVTDDMGRYSLWLGGEPDPAAATPQLWLERLEASYTMEEMRSSHHGTVQVERATAVEFF